MQATQVVFGQGSGGDTTGYDRVPDKRSYSSLSRAENNKIISTAFGAVTDGEDAMVQLRFRMLL